MEFPASVEHLLEAAHERGVRVHVEIHPPARQITDCITLAYLTKTGGHVLVVPKIGENHIPRNVIRSIIGERDVKTAFERGMMGFPRFKSGEMTPFLGAMGFSQSFYFDEDSVRRNGLVRMFNSPKLSVVMKYGDAYRLIETIHPHSATLVDFQRKTDDRKSKTKA